MHNHRVAKNMANVIIKTTEELIRRTSLYVHKRVAKVLKPIIPCSSHKLNISIKCRIGKYKLSLLYNVSTDEMDPCIIKQRVIKAATK